jgi:hypothetical protein
MASGVEQPDLKEFKVPLTTNDIGLNITHQLVIDTLATLDATKAAGPDELNNRVLKEARFHLGEVVTNLFNASLRESFVPSQWKQSNIIPIPKVLNPTMPNECRPVCLTSCLGKVMEKIIAKDIFLDFNDDHTQQSIERMARWSEDKQQHVTASQTSKNQMQTQQRRFLNVIGISAERAFYVHNIKPM